MEEMEYESKHTYELYYDRRARKAWSHNINALSDDQYDHHVKTIVHQENRSVIITNDELNKYNPSNDRPLLIIQNVGSKNVRKNTFCFSTELLWFSRSKKTKRASLVWELFFSKEEVTNILGAQIKNPFRILEPGIIFRLKRLTKADLR